ncbi:hypothetical protein [Hafnia psychrotolerans]|uniref:Uncharacterized protein n=1 Tax=Hafnia psychrotolerans TaxID=1477018 RepID=A0ABQ1FZH4_9GAMM|nr:hypothetical protein [Hafnia psychrotolerans]GGA33856.1 hypothetical protein GCM10011328_05870 [Hafnia psychrotolerans]
MIKRFLAWLISIYTKPTPVETKTPGVTMTDQVVDIPAQVAASAAPAAEVKAGVADFEAALRFVESGVAQLGEAAKDELKELAKKYL